MCGSLRWAAVTSGRPLTVRVFVLQTINIALATLTGAGEPSDMYKIMFVLSSHTFSYVPTGCMNNTFTLAIFLLIIYVKGLVWEVRPNTIMLRIILDTNHRMCPKAHNLWVHVA